MWDVQRILFLLRRKEGTIGTSFSRRSGRTEWRPLLGIGAGSPACSRGFVTTPAAWRTCLDMQTILWLWRVTSEVSASPSLF